MFYVLGAGGVASALLVVTRRNPIISALYLIVNFFCLAGLYLTLNAQFIAVIQIIVYAGAIMVLFVIMLLNLGDDRKLSDAITVRKVVGAGLTLGLFMEVLYILLTAGPADSERAEAAGIALGTVEAIGAQLFTTFLFPFEVTSLILTAAIVGAVVMAKKKLD